MDNSSAVLCKILFLLYMQVRVLAYNPLHNVKQHLRLCIAKTLTFPPSPVPSFHPSILVNLLTTAYSFRSRLHAKVNSALVSLFIKRSDS